MIIYSRTKYCSHQGVSGSWWQQLASGAQFAAEPVLGYCDAFLARLGEGLLHALKATGSSAARASGQQRQGHKAAYRRQSDPTEYTKLLAFSPICENRIKVHLSLGR